MSARRLNMDFCGVCADMRLLPQTANSFSLLRTSRIVSIASHFKFFSKNSLRRKKKTWQEK